MNTIKALSRADESACPFSCENYCRCQSWMKVMKSLGFFSSSVNDDNCVPVYFYLGNYLLIITFLC